MEEITMDRLLNDFSGVITQLNDIIARKDIASAKEALEQIQELVVNEEKVTLDDRENPQMDHVLHELLSNIAGVIEIDDNRNIGNNFKTKNQLIDDLENELKQLKEEFRKIAVSMKNAREEGEGEEEAFLHKEYNRLTGVIGKLESNLEIAQSLDIRDGQSIQEAQKELDEEINKNKEEFKKVAEAMKRAREEGKGEEEAFLHKEYNRLTILLNDLEKKSLNMKELSGINESQTRDTSDNSTQLHVKEEAKKIGDKIFKTAAIRKELSARNISREEFLDFYKQGKQASEDKMKDIRQKVDIYGYEAAVVDGSDHLIKKLFDHGLNETEKIDLYEKVRNNIVKIDRLKEKLEENGFLDNPITNAEQLKEFEKIVNYWELDVQTNINKLNEEYKEYQEDIEIFDQEIDKIEKEFEALKVEEDLAKGKMTDLDKDSKEEKELRAKQIRATVYGDEELEKEWDKRITRFHSHKIPQKQTVIIDGKEVEIDFETVNDYEGIEEDEYFLNLADYKKYLELTSIYENVVSKTDKQKGLEFIKSILDKNEAELQEYFELSKKDSSKADELLEQYLGEKKEYVTTYHGFTNEHAVKEAVYKTSGTTLKAMKPVKGNYPIPVKMANGAENFFRFFGIRKPEFTTKNENGEKVKTIGKGVGTIAIDAALVGAVTATGIVTGPIGLATWGAAYAAKGAVTLGNRIAGKREYKKHKDVIDANLPTLSKATGYDREVIRKDYYRELIKRENETDKITVGQKISTWAHAKTDKLPFRKKAAKETEEALINERIDLSNYAIDRRTNLAKQSVSRNASMARENQIVRQFNTREEARSADTYNDIVRDPDKINNEEAIGRIARNATLRTNDSLNREDVNFGSSEKRTDKYQKENPKMYSTRNIVNVENEGDTVAVTAITEEQKYTARQQHQDRINRVLTILLTAGLRVGIGYANNEYIKHINKTKTETKVTPGSKKYVEGKTHKEPIYEEKVEYSLNTNKKISDLKYKDEALNDVYGGPNISNGKLNSDIDAFVIGTKDANGRTIEVSIAEAGKGFTTRHVRALTDENLSNLSISQAIEKLKQVDPTTFNNYLKTVGLSENASAEEIAKVALEQGHFYVQSGKMEGWRSVLSGNMDEKYQKIIKGYNTIKGKGHLEEIPGKVSTTTSQVTKDVFSASKVAKTAVKGAAAGAAVTVANDLHEANNQTKRVDVGIFEKRNPHLFVSRLAANYIKTKNIKHEDRNDEER